jgi:hypothetical protein
MPGAAASAPPRAAALNAATKYQTVVNLKAAKILGFEIPPSHPTLISSATKEGADAIQTNFDNNLASSPRTEGASPCLTARRR